jgi:hypothetical protein
MSEHFLRLTKNETSSYSVVTVARNSLSIYLSVTSCYLYSCTYWLILKFILKTKLEHFMKLAQDSF